MTITLNRLPIGQAAVVERVDTDVKISRRLRELGVFRGGTVEFVGAAPLGDPVEVTVRGYELSLRKADADMIEVQ